jgi:hypothetical protein
LGLLSNDWLVESDTFDQLGVLDRSSDLFDDPDISEIDVGRGRRDETGDCRNCNGGEGGRVLRNDLVLST